MHKRLKGRLPFLGAKDFDIQANVNTIIAEDGICSVDFLGKAQQMQTSIKISGLLTMHIVFIKHFFAQVIRCGNLQAPMATNKRAVKWQLFNTG